MSLHSLMKLGRCMDGMECVKQIRCVLVCETLPASIDTSCYTFSVADTFDTRLIHSPILCA